MLFLVMFSITATLTFGVTMFVVRPTSEQKAMQRRLAKMKADQSAVVPGGDDLRQYLKTLQRGSFGWIEDVIDGSKIQRFIQKLIIQADQTTSVGTVLMSCAGCAGPAAILIYFFSSKLLLAALAMLAGGYIPIAILNYRKISRVNAFNAALPDCIDMMARALRAGNSLNAAISIVADQAVGPAKMEFSEVSKKQNYGLPMREALMQLLDRVPSQDLRVLITGILVQKDTGGNLVEILERILNVIRERIRLKGDIQTHTAQGRLTGWILCGLPVILLVLLNIIDPGYSSVLFNNPFGQKMLYVGAVLLFIGAFLINKIVKGIEI